MQRNKHNGLDVNTKNPPFKKVKRLKKDIINSVNGLVPSPMTGLDKLTIATLEDLENNLKEITS